MTAGGVSILGPEQTHLTHIVRMEALPVAPGGPNARSAVPATGNVLTAYP
jgi:hypothetical protein